MRERVRVKLIITGQLTMRMRAVTLTLKQMRSLTLKMMG